MADHSSTAVTIPFRRPEDLRIVTANDEELMDAVVLWLCGAPDEEVQRKLNTDAAHLRWIVKKPGWGMLTDAIRRNVQRVAGDRMLRVANRALDLIEERIEGGDPIYGMSGEVIGKRAVRVKDLALIASQMADRHANLDGGVQKTPDGEKPLTLKDLADLLEREAKLKHAKEIDITPTVQ